MDITRFLVQDATLWSGQTPDGFGGCTPGSPVHIKVRWEDKAVRYAGRIDGNEEVSRAVVFLDRDVQVGDYLFLGLSTDADPTALEGAFQVRKFDKVPDLRSVSTVRRAIL